MENLVTIIILGYYIKENQDIKLKKISIFVQISNNFNVVNICTIWSSYISSLCLTDNGITNGNVSPLLIPKSMTKITKSKEWLRAGVLGFSKYLETPRSVNHEYRMFGIKLYIPIREELFV